MTNFLPKPRRITHGLRLLASFLLVFISGAVFAQNCSINAGVDASICAGQTILLDGSIGGPKNNSTIQWSIVSQPAAASVAITKPIV